MNELLAELAAKCPAWATATMLVKDERGEIVGYGWIRKNGGVVVKGGADGVWLLGEPDLPCSQITIPV